MTVEVNQTDKTHEFKLVGGDDRKTVPVTDSIRVGRDAECELVIASGKVSRVHAIVSVDEGILWVEDQQSTNGTFVNGERVASRTRLNDGDRVRFNNQVFLVVAPEPAPAAGDATIVAVGDATIVGEAATMLNVPAMDSPEQGAKPASNAGEPTPAAASTTPADAEPGAAAIPASWADSDQLERSSETAFMVRKPDGSDDAKAPKLEPAEAVRQARETVPAEVAILVGLTRPVRGRAILLGLPSDTKKWEMGRGESEDIQLDDESVSGRHAQLIHEQGRWKVVNLMSVNGTFVNERKVLSAFLSPGDCIRMGEVELVFDARVESAKASNVEQPDPDKPAGGLLGWLKRLFGRHQD